MKPETRKTLTFLRSLLPQRQDFEDMRRAPGRDLIAGITVAIVALPLALAFGVASGLGAAAGLTTAIIAGVLAAVFGGSNVQISGPTGAMTVVLIPVVHKFGAAGVLQTGVLAGIILVALACSGVGRYVRYLPAPLIEGFTAGIAVVISLQQFPYLLGVTPPDAAQVLTQAGRSLQTWAEDPNFVPIATALSVTAVIVIGARWRPKMPMALIAVALATAIAAWLKLDLTEIGTLPTALNAPSAGFWQLNQISALMPSAFAIAALAALESLLSATVADGMSVGERHNPDRELLGQGIANLAVPFFGGVPATAAIARTAVNVRSGARSRISAIMHSFVLLLIMVGLGPIVSKIPLAALAGVLLATTIHMVQISAIRAMLKATRGDAAVLLITFTVTLVIDLVAAVAVGFAVATLLLLRTVARNARLARIPLEAGDHSDEELELLEQHIIAYRFDGPLFFGAAHRFLLELTDVSDVQVVILRMSRVVSLDVTGALTLDDAIRQLQQRGVIVVLSGIKPRHRAVLRTLGAAQELKAAGRIFETTPQAIAYAKQACISASIQATTHSS